MKTVTSWSLSLFLRKLSSTYWPFLSLSLCRPFSGKFCLLKGFFNRNFFSLSFSLLLTLVAFF